MNRIFLSIFISASLFATEKLQIYDDSNTLLFESSAYSQIVEQLRSIGVRFEKWDANRPLSANATQQEIFDAYSDDICRLQEENGYTCINLTRMDPDSPKQEIPHNTFSNESIHTESEARFFVEGEGLFYLHMGGRVCIVLCQPSDLISIPAHYPHWFDMETSPQCTTLRFF